VPPGLKDIPVDLKSMSLIQSGNNFAFDVFMEVQKSEQEEKNLMISPLSISLALAMTYNGADHATKDAFEKVLHLNGLSVEDINKSYQSLVEALLSVDPKVIMEIANSIWYRNTFHVEDEFLNVNKTYYDARVSGLNFADPTSLKTINQWVSDHTHEKIDKIIDQIDPMDIMYLINAVYFKGTWKYQFDEKYTQEAPFYDEKGNSTGNAEMMHIKGDISYTSNELFQAIDLPYGQGNFSMIILLPEEGKSLNDVVENMTDQNWKTWTDSFYENKDFDIYIPKFKFEYKKKLNDVLISLGLGEAFSGHADFTKINPQGNLSISEVMHKTFIEVNEEGTEAAAVTSVTIRLTSIGPSNEFRADHPFIFVIRERTTGTIMFMGKVIEPETGS
jgi:serpin B